MPFECKKCGKKFPSQRNLARHLDRKRPCTYAQEPQLGKALPKCQGCGKEYSRHDHLKRHQVKCAKFQDPAYRSQEVSEIKSQISELSKLVSRLTTPAPEKQTKPLSTHNGSSAVNVGCGAVTTTNITVNAWDGKDRLVVPLDLLKDALRESDMVREYCALPEINRHDPEVVPVYVVEALIAVIRRAHKMPESWNIRPSPERADQVQVFVKEGGGHWDIISLSEAVGLLLRDAAAGILRAADEPRAARVLTPEERSASFVIPMEYRRQPEKYDKEGRGRVSAHLASLRIRTCAQASQKASPGDAADEHSPEDAA